MLISDQLSPADQFIFYNKNLYVASFWFIQIIKHVLIKFLYFLKAFIFLEGKNKIL